MCNVILFCKSYRQDMYRARRLAASIHRYNGDAIPFYISVPEKDLEQFQKCFTGLPCEFLSDEEILMKSKAVFGEIPKDFPEHLGQQLVKLEFWRMGLCKNYIWLDSDSYFIKRFTHKDFFLDEETPYTVRHHAEELMDFARRTGRGKIIDDFNRMAVKFQKMFQRQGPLYDFGGPPLPWSVKVLENLYEDYLNPEGKTIFSLLAEYPCEMQLYGEYALHCQKIPIVPVASFFKIFHYKEQFFESQSKGESEFEWSQNYLGVIMQSNWAGIQKKKKSPGTRLQKFIKDIL